jgi:excisionase family DNA binding protein
MPRTVPKIPTSERLALRINEAAAIAGLGRSTVYLLMAAGRLTTVKIGGRRLVLRESLEELLAPSAASDPPNGGARPA